MKWKVKALRVTASKVVKGLGYGEVCLVSVIQNCIGLNICVQVDLIINNSGRQTNVSPSTSTSLMSDFPTGLFFSSTVSSLSRQSGFSKSCRSICVLSQNSSALQPQSWGLSTSPSPYIPQTHLHAFKYTKANTHRCTVARACVHMCSFVEPCASFFNAQVTSHPRRLCTFIRATSSLICRKMQTNKNTGKKNI